MVRPTIRDVARLAGVSTATVSYVINNTGSVSDATAQKVMACVDQVGYRANSVAVAHRTGRSNAIGLAVPYLTNPFFPEFAQGVHRAASADGFSVLLLDGDTSPEREVEGVRRLADRLPGGLIWCPVRDDIISDADFSFPTVVYDREVPGFDSVRADIRRGGELQAEALLEHGHTQIGLISGPSWSDTAQLRRAGFVERVGNQAEIVWQFEVGHSAELPTEMAGRILADTRATAAIAANDIQAIRLMSLFQNAGRRIPDDMSIVGFDDVELARLVSPSLTTVRLRPAQLGERAFQVLIDRIKNPDTPLVHPVLPVELVLRDSLRSV